MKNFNKFFTSLSSGSSLKRGKVRQHGMEERVESLDHIIAKKISAINGLVFRNKGRGLIGYLLQIT
jgi:hypothetical protein